MACAQQCLLLLLLLAGTCAYYQPSWEDFERDEQFVRGKMNVTGEVPDRLSNVSHEVFAQYFQQGRPLIVTDMIETWKMKDWTCSSVAEDFGEEEIIVWSYNEGSRAKKWHKLKDISNWQSAVMDQHENVKDPKAPKRLSFHWYPVQQGIAEDEVAYRDGDDYTSTLASPAARRAIKAAYKLPSFIEPNPMNLEFTKERIEFFMGMPGSGASVHADGVCEAIFAVQLSGVKQWRLSPLPPYERAVQQRSPVLQGGRGRLWKPTYTFDLHPGEAIFFPPSFMHETHVVGEGCSLSASLQIRYPFPVGHIRDFSKRILNSAEASFCFEHWAPFVTGHKDGVREMFRRIYHGREPKTVISEMFDEIDVDQDGKASLIEKTNHFDRVIQQHHGQVEFMAGQEAKDWFAFNDVNKDGVVDLDEYLKLHTELQKNYKSALEQGACDEEGCHDRVLESVLAGEMHGIESAYISNTVHNPYGHDEV